MDKQIIEITETKRYLSLLRGFMVVSDKEKELARLPLDMIGVVLANTYGVTVSNQLLIALAENNIPFIVCGKNHSPQSVLWPVSGNYRHAACMDAQINRASINKRIWKEIITNKIKCQKAVLQSLNLEHERLKVLQDSVKSGDKDNNEAAAAKYYWSKLFGGGFVRDRDEPGINAFLNYGYTILRSLTARSIMSVGLNPVLGIFHSNKLNPMRLADDIMEPFRPMVDQLVYFLHKEGNIELDRKSKRILAGVHILPLISGGIHTSLGFAVMNLAKSISQMYLEESEILVFPESIVNKTDIFQHMDD